MSVPVLSTSTVSTLAAGSRTAPPLIITPRRAAFPTAATTAVGVARTRTQGQAMTRTAMTRKRSEVANQTQAQTPRMSGVKTDANLSATRWVRPFRLWAPRTTWTMRPRAVASLTRATSTSKAPDSRIVPV